MDEPTSSLSEKEVGHLFTIIDKLKQRGCGIIYISHKMEEIFKICDEITILRDGKWIDTVAVKETTMDELVAKMVGRSLTQRFPEKNNTPGEVVLQVKNLTAKNQPSIRDVSFELRKGEVLGIGGLVGAKRTDIVETLFGIRERGEGGVLLHGKKVQTQSENNFFTFDFSKIFPVDNQSEIINKELTIETLNETWDLDDMSN